MLDEKELETWKLELIKRRAEENSRLCVIYNPNCGCNVDQFVILDRYPMSEKIRCLCPSCHKGCAMEISDPILFHLPLTNQDFSLEDLKNSVITASPQEWIIRKYCEQ